MKNKTITLSEKELKLLMMILEEAEDDRSNMGCNDPYENEEKLFTKKERIEIAKTMMEDDDEEMDGFLFNNWFVQHIINVIEKQTSKKSVGKKEKKKDD